MAEEAASAIPPAIVIQYILINGLKACNPREQVLKYGSRDRIGLLFIDVYLLVHSSDQLLRVNPRVQEKGQFLLLVHEVYQDESASGMGWLQGFIRGWVLILQGGFVVEGSFAVEGGFVAEGRFYSL